MIVWLVLRHIDTILEKVVMCEELAQRQDYALEAELLKVGVPQVVLAG